MLKALIFDVDGTLADTEELHRQAFNAAFVEFGLWWDWGTHRYAELLAVSGGKERIRRHIETLGLPDGERARLEAIVPRLHSAKTRIYAELLSAGRLALRPGVSRLLREASEAGLALAIASTTTSANVDVLLRAALARQRSVRFGVIACGDQVAAKKPAPDIYRLVLASLRLSASDCVAFEDSRNGLLAAKGAGLATVVTPTRWTAAQDFAEAALVLPSLEGLELARLEALAGASRAAA